MAGSDGETLAVNTQMDTKVTVVPPATAVRRLLELTREWESRQTVWAVATGEPGRYAPFRMSEPRGKERIFVLWPPGA